MNKLHAKSLTLTALSKSISFENNEVYLSYFVPSKLKLKFYKENKNLVSLILYKRFIKHSFLPKFLKNQFTPGLGILKFKTFIELDKFLSTDLEKLLQKFPSLLLADVFFKKNYMFFLPLKNYNFSKIIIFNPNLNLIVSCLNIIKIFPLVFVNLIKCMLYILFYKNLNAHT